MLKKTKDRNIFKVTFQSGYTKIVDRQTGQIKLYSSYSQTFVPQYIANLIESRRVEQ
jgi:hypothetical protein